MKKIDVIYEAIVSEFYKEEVSKVYAEIFFDKKEAIDFCTGIVKKRFKELKGAEIVTTGSLLQFMNDKEYKFELLVAEHSARERDYENRDGYVQVFRKFIKDKNADLYKQLLSIINSNRHWYDYFGNVVNVFTDGTGNANDNSEYATFTEELCKDGKYRGAFEYFGYKVPKEELAYKTAKRMYFTSAETYREPTDDDGYDWQNGWYVDYEKLNERYDDAVKYSCYEPYYNMDKYFDSEDRFAVELTEEQEKETFAEKVKDYSVVMKVISSNAIVFESQKELAEYYAEQVSSGDITEENVYDFLLSLVKYEERHYDVNENLLRSRIVRQELDGTRDYDIVPDFSMENAKAVLKLWEKRKELLHEIK